MKVSGFRLMELYENKGYSRRSFAKIIGVTEATVRRWETGTNVKKEYLDKICETLEVVPADLKLDEVMAIGKGNRKIPVIRLPGTMQEVQEYMYFDLKGVSVIIVADSSMEPKIANGEYVFIEETANPIHGAVMLVEVDGQLHLRECIKTNRGYTFIPRNPRKETFTECKVIGKVKRWTTGD